VVSNPAAFCRLHFLQHIDQNYEFVSVPELGV